jgi:glycosyltransferase involved in cell wall biosynthesis
MPRTVVVVADAADAKGGASKVAIESARLLAQSGIDVRLFAATGPFEPLGEPLPNLRAHTLADGFNLMRASAPVRAVHSLWNRPAAEAFGEMLQDLSPAETVVHVHSFQVQLTASVVHAAHGRGFPLVVTSHDYGLACPYSGFYDYNTGAPCGRRALSLGCATTLCNGSRSVAGKLWHVVKGGVQRGVGKVAERADHLAFVSDFSREILAPYLPPGKPTSVIPNPIDLPQGPPRKLEPGAPFLFVGRLTREKGGLLAAQAAAALGVPLLVAGTGPEEEELREACPSVRMLGWQSPQQVREWMRHARALVFPSRWYEGQPLTVQEAQSVGLPVISSDVCAASGTISHGEDGLLFRSGDLDDLKRQMDLLTDDALACALGQAAYDRYWCDPPTNDRHLRATLQVYADVLGRA